MKTTIPDEMKIATCKICILATTMRDCKACAFNVGLLYKSLDLVAQVEPVTSLAPIVRDNFIAQIKNDTVSTLKG